MKIITIALLAVTLLSAEEKKVTPNPNALTATEAAKWKEINDSVKTAADASERAELAFYRAKEARDKALADANAVLAKMQADAKCPACLPVAAPDGSLSWPKPVEKK